MIVLRILGILIFLYAVVAYLWQEWKKVKKAPHDKKLHTLAGIVIFFVVALLFYRWSISIVPLVCVVLAGIGKEIYDKWVKKTMFDWDDVYATFMGGIYSLLVWVIVVVIITQPWR